MADVIRVLECQETNHNGSYGEIIDRLDSTRLRLAHVSSKSVLLHRWFASLLLAIFHDVVDVQHLGDTGGTEHSIDDCGTRIF